jgi:hypothetical protein
MRQGPGTPVDDGGTRGYTFADDGVEADTSESPADAEKRERGEAIMAEAEGEG